ncbi:MAG: 3-deoxy-D-manno-octulosonic acid transferase [Bacteroidetes bacterium]|nr:3-deoxy-D-manno-octulosonic acid transferase [Bacteroidota bacterium]
MHYIYDLVLKVFYLAIRCAGIFNFKAAKWIQGRRNQFDHISQAIKTERPLVWFHCASLGEFEQGRPVLEAFRREHPDFLVLLTFFSPSGYEVRRNYPDADYIFYLPFDIRKNAEKFICYTKPTLVFFVKYEYWYNYIDILFRHSIPILMLSAIFRPNQVFFKWYGGWFRHQLKKISFFFVQNDLSVGLLSDIGITNVMTSGDTRFDRVYDISQKPGSYPSLETFKQNHPLLLAGSTWPQDEDILTDFINNSNDEMKYIIAPHEVAEEHIHGLLSKLKGNAVRYSRASQEELNRTKVVIIDSIGMLSHLYQYCTVAYIGGGFGKGIHNILEAATFGKPIIFGPNFSKFQEARDLIKAGGAFSIDNRIQLTEIVMKLFEDKIFYSSCSDTCHHYIVDNKGATEKIMLKMKDFLNH